MGDLPPPSYDDAITGDYSSPPPEPSSPPPSFPETPEPPLFNGETTSLSSGQDQLPPTSASSPGLEEQQGLNSSHVTVDVDNASQNSESGSKKSRNLKIGFLVACILVGVTILYFVISPGKEDQHFGDTHIGCNNDPPNVQGSTRKYCPYSNTPGVYNERLSCKFECPKDHVLYSRTYNRLTKNTNVSYVCMGDDKWISNFPDSMPYRDNEKLECLHRPPPTPSPSHPDDCKYQLPVISNGRYTDCTKNDIGEYTRGTKCSFKCDGEMVLSNSKGFLNSEYETSGAYTCVKAKWFFEERRLNIKCLSITDFIKENIG